MDLAPVVVIVVTNFVISTSAVAQERADAEAEHAAWCEAYRDHIDAGEAQLAQLIEDSWSVGPTSPWISHMEPPTRPLPTTSGSFLGSSSRAHAENYEFWIANGGPQLQRDIELAQADYERTCSRA